MTGDPVKRTLARALGAYASRGAGLLVAVAFVGGCATAGAKSEPGGPPLEIPEPPPRSVSDLPTAPPTPTTVAAPEGPRRPRPAPKPAAAPEPAAESAPSPPLQLAPAAGGSLVTAESVRSLLAQTAKRLDQLLRATLSTGRQAQYDTARRFLDQAGTALTAGNVTFAHYLGEKADALARDLVP